MMPSPTEVSVVYFVLICCLYEGVVKCLYSVTKVIVPMNNFSPSVCFLAKVFVSMNNISSSVCFFGKSVCSYE